MITTKEILALAKEASKKMTRLTTEEKNSALMAMAKALREDMALILSENALDMANAKGKISDVMLDRLALTESRIEDMALGIEQVAADTVHERVFACEAHKRIGP